MKEKDRISKVIFLENQRRENSRVNTAKNSGEERYRLSLLFFVGRVFGILCFNVYASFAFVAFKTAVSVFNFVFESIIVSAIVSTKVRISPVRYSPHCSGNTLRKLRTHPHLRWWI